MKLLHFNVENWWSLLKYLNSDLKLELAGRLIESLKEKPEPKREENDDWLKLYGAWSDEEDAKKLGL